MPCWRPNGMHLYNVDVLSSIWHNFLFVECTVGMQLEVIWRISRKLYWTLSWHFLCYKVKSKSWPKVFTNTWWRHQMETFSVPLAICAGNSPVPGEFPTQRPMTWSFDVYFDLRPNKRLGKQSWGWWFETPSRPLWRRRNDLAIASMCYNQNENGGNFAHDNFKCGSFKQIYRGSHFIEISC